MSHSIFFRSDTINPVLDASDWSIPENETWGIIGEEDQHREQFSRWMQSSQCARGNAESTDNKEPLLLAVVDFDSEQKLILEEKRNDDSEFLEGGFDPGTLVEDYLNLNENLNESSLPTKNELLDLLIKELKLRKLAKTGLRSLSNGEIRKVMITKALQAAPDILLLENPFDGLDTGSRQQLSTALHMISARSTIIFLLSQHKDLPEWTNRVLHISNTGGARSFSTQQFNERWPISNRELPPSPNMEHLLNTSPDEPSKQETLVQLDKINISFSGRSLFNNFSWTIKSGEHWKLSGPNGAGKTTLLQIIHADLPQSYSQNIQLFGYQRGQGESIWDIRRHIGFLGTDSQRQFPKNMTGLAAVCSGLHNTIGVYKMPSNIEIKQSREWIQHFGLEHLSKKILSEMNYAETRMILSLRAMIHTPKLLILDEPCQGLNERQQDQIFDFIDGLIQKTSTQLLYVTHDVDDRLSSITHQIKLSPDSDGISRAQFTTP